MATRSDIKPCPFCGEDNLRVERDSSDGVSFYVICNECLAQGPCSLTSEDDAVERWDNRWALSLWALRS